MTKHERRGKGHLYSEADKKEFVRRYGKEKGTRIWGLTVGKVRREQIAKGELPRKHTFRTKKGAMDLAKQLRKGGKKVHVTVKGLVRKKYTVHVR